MIQHQITLTTAIELTTNFRENPVPDMPIAETYTADAVLALLNQPGCVSLRLYSGRKNDDRICSVLVGVNAQNQDILPPIDADTSSNNDPIILEDAFQCPPACPPPSPLNP